MPNNLKDVMIDIARIPESIEGMVPLPLPSISQVMVDVAKGMPAMSNFPIDLPALPLPAMPKMGGNGGSQAAASVDAPAPAKRGLVQFTYE